MGNLPSPSVLQHAILIFTTTSLWIFVGFGFLIVLVFFICSTARHEGLPQPGTKLGAPGVLVCGLPWTAWEVPWFLFLI